MKIVSFDIGIKTMAYCIFGLSCGVSKPLYGQTQESPLGDVKINTQSGITILDWDILNLLEDNCDIDIEIHNCNCSLISKKKGEQNKICNKKSKYMKGSLYYCDKHAKLCSEFIIPIKECSLISLKKKKISDLIDIYTKYNIDIGEHKLKKDILNDISSFFDRKFLEPIVVTKKKNASETDLIVIGRNMMIALDQIRELTDIDHIIIENQISPIANRMKSIQCMLAQYFIMRCSPNTTIEFVSSSNKLKSFRQRQNENKLDTGAYCSPNIRIPENQTECQKYKQHKSDSILFTRELIQENENFIKWESIFAHKKKDDLCDAFLQGIWYLNKKNIT